MEEKVILGIESTLQSHKISEVKMEISWGVMLTKQFSTAGR